MFEGTSLPEEVGWERIASTPIERFLLDGHFIQVVDEGNELDAYQRPLASFAGTSEFFVEWRVETDAPESILDTWGTPVVVSAGGSSAAHYHFTMTDGRLRVLRGTLLPVVFLDIQPGVPHTYRLELSGGNRYVWYVDGQLGDLGTPVGSYPSADSVLIWGTRRQGFDSTTCWDYLRFGLTPHEGSGDYDSDGAATPDDFYFFHECLTNDRPGINGGPDNDAGPGCRFADFDSDSDTDLRDFAAFENAFVEAQ